jgi:hypothetical protein
MTQPAHPTYLPNLYDLFSKRVHVQYALSGIDGKPRLHYRDKSQEKTFTGDEIRGEDTSIGRLVTVTLEVVPDLHTISFSFFLPTINLEREAHVVTEGLYTTARTSIGGPRLVKGQLETWRAITLSGMARVVEF